MVHFSIPMPWHASHSGSGIPHPSTWSTCWARMENHQPWNKRWYASLSVATTYGDRKDQERMNGIWMDGFKGKSWPETMFSPSNVGCPAHFPIKCIQTLGDALTKLEAMGTSSSNIGDVPLWCLPEGSDSKKDSLGSIPKNWNFRTTN